MAVLLLADHNPASLTPATLAALGAASQLPGPITVLVTGDGAKAAADQAATCAGVTRVLLADSPLYAHGLAETLAPLVAGLGKGFSHIVAPASPFGKNLLPRVAALMDMAQVSEITRIESPTRFQRPVYAGNAIATVEATDPVVLLTIRPSSFASAEPGQQAPAPIDAVTPTDAPALSRFVGQELSKSERPDLGSAKIVVSGGRGLQSGENFKLLENLADLLGGAVGASRAAVDAGYVPNDYQIGQTGKVVAPNLYIAVGISGAIQHLAGMKDSKIIVAINKDPDAPIFNVADYGLVGDLFTIVPEMIAEIGKARG
jgi:electron transfer flavoprotein alpha subunit